MFKYFKNGSSTAALGCGVILDEMNNGDDDFTSGSGMALFFLAWPLLFVLFLRGLLFNQRRKFIFSQF